MTTPPPTTSSHVPWLLGVAGLGVLIGMVLSVHALYSNSFYQHTPAGVATLEYGIGFALGVIPSIALVVASRRDLAFAGSSRRSSVGLVVGILLTAVSIVFSGLPFASSLVGLTQAAT